MTALDLQALLPLVLTTATAIAVMIAVTITRRHGLAAWLCAAGLAAAIASIASARECAPRHISDLLVIDSFARFYSGLILAGSLVVAVLSYGYLKLRTDRHEEYYILLPLAAVGSLVIVCSANLLAFLLGLELLSICLFALIAYRRTGRGDLEAAVKYLILAGASSAFAVFGAALIYADRGSLAFGPPGLELSSPVALAGIAALLVGVGFKLALVPFHFWTPDVYQGAPAPIAGFIATVSKGAVFALALRYLSTENLLADGRIIWLLTAIAAASMLAGNLLALRQDNVKRMLAYSSIAHVGYLLIALLASASLGRPAAAIYLTAYFLASLGAFGVVGALSQPTRDADALADYRGLAWRRPFLAFTLTAMLLSLAGLPLTAGFVGKLSLVFSGVSSALWLLLSALVLGSVISIFYYLRLLAALFATPPASEPAISSPNTPWPTTAALLFLTVALLAIGLWPAPLLDLIQKMAVAAW